MEEVEKARKKAEKLAKKTLDLTEKEEKKDALGNTIVEVGRSFDDRKCLFSGCGVVDNVVNLFIFD